MTQAVIGGALGALGLWLLWASLFPTPEPLARGLARLRSAGPVAPRSEHADTAESRFGHWLASRRPFVGLAPRITQDLAIVHRSPEQYATSMVTFGLIGLLWAPTVAAGGLLLGIPIPLTVPAVFALGGALLAPVLSHRQLRAEASHARAAFRHALSAYCDVAGMAMASGREVYAALFDAAAAGEGAAFASLRGALQVGFVAGEKPWESLRRLGEQIGVDDLAELAATMALAGDEGAAVRDTVAARARSIRARLTTDAEKRAAAATERMAVPGAMLLIGFLWFLTYPALALMLQQSH